MKLKIIIFTILVLLSIGLFFNKKTEVDNNPYLKLNNDKISLIVSDD
jgi:uncharacterized protein YxeA